MSIEIGRIRIVTDGWVGAPGLSQIYFTGATPGAVSNTDCVNAAAAIRTFYNTLQNFTESTWRANVQGTVQVLEATTGALIREESITPPAQVVGLGSTGWGSTASGCVVTWHTAGVFGGRLLRGRTFLTPLSKTSYETTGQLKSSDVATLASAGSTLAGSATANTVVWHRPHPNKAAANGGYADMTGCTATVKEAILRSRRD